MTLIVSVDLFGLLSHEGVNDYWSYLVPISLFLIGLMNPLTYLKNREQNFNAISNSRINQSLGTGVSQVLFGLLKLGYIGMIFGHIIGMILSIISLCKDIQMKKLRGFKINKNLIKEVAFEYRDFPKYAMVTHSIEAVTSNIPQLLLKRIYGASTTGFYSLSVRTVSIPLTMIGKSIGDVFLSSASKEFRENGNCINAYKKTFLLLAFIPIIPFVILFLTAENLFTFVFGKEWMIAGQYTKVLIPALYINFIANPLANMFIVAQKVRIEFYFQIIVLILTVSAFTYGFYYSITSYQMIILFSFILGIKNILSLILSYNFSKGIQKNNVS